MRIRNIYTLVMVSSLALLSINTSFAEDKKTAKTKDKGFISEMGDVLEDMGTVTIIMAKYAKDPLLGFFQLQVFIDGDHVTLKGDVETDMQYERALMLALNTKGVATVDGSGIKIKKSDHLLDDIYITAVAKSKIFGMALFDSEDPEVWTIKVETKDSVIFVTGEVDSEETKQKVLKELKEIKNVKDVESDIKIIKK